MLPESTKEDPGQKFEIRWILLIKTNLENLEKLMLPHSKDWVLISCQLSLMCLASRFLLSCPYNFLDLVGSVFSKLLLKEHSDFKKSLRDTVNSLQKPRRGL